MARKTRNTQTAVTETPLTIVFPQTAAMAVDLDTFLEKRDHVAVETRNARFGMSYVITAPRADLKALLDITIPRAKPDGTVGQPSSWGHGARKAVERITKALAGGK